jgi:transposase
MKYKYQQKQKMRAMERDERIRAYVVENKDKNESYAEIGNHFGVSTTTVMKALKKEAVTQ